MMVETSQVISEYPFLDEPGAQSVLTRLDQHREIAIDRNPGKPGTFVTYGRAAYLDVCLPRANPQTDYFGAIQKSNRELLAAVGDFYEELRCGLERILGDPVAYEPEALALPGIHIFRGAGIRSAGEAGAHFDVQYQKLSFPTPPDSGPPPLSITLPLRAPVHGTGLQVYHVSYADYERNYRAGRINTVEELVRRKTSAYYPYTLGKLMLHRGLVMHCLATPGPIEPSDERITLQGHGVRCGGTWILYW
jgi:hypothetical protein